MGLFPQETEGMSKWDHFLEALDALSRYERRIILKTKCFTRLQRVIFKLNKNQISNRNLSLIIKNY